MIEVLSIISSQVLTAVFIVFCLWLIFRNPFGFKGILRGFNYVIAGSALFGFIAGWKEGVALAAIGGIVVVVMGVINQDIQ